MAFIHSQQQLRLFHWTSEIIFGFNPKIIVEHINQKKVYNYKLKYSKNSTNAQVKFQFPKKSCNIRILLRFWNYSTYFFRQNKNQKNNIFFTKI
jgi:hypothetical protein